MVRQNGQSLAGLHFWSQFVQKEQMEGGGFEVWRLHSPFMEMPRSPLQSYSPTSCKYRYWCATWRMEPLSLNIPPYKNWAKESTRYLGKCLDNRTPSTCGCIQKQLQKQFPRKQGHLDSNWGDSIELQILLSDLTAKENSNANWEQVSFLSPRAHSPGRERYNATYSCKELWCEPK